jgi:hypothetical protein
MNVHISHTGAHQWVVQVGYAAYRIFADFDSFIGYGGVTKIADRFWSEHDRKYDGCVGIRLQEDTGRPRQLRFAKAYRRRDAGVRPCWET